LPSPKLYFPSLSLSPFALFFILVNPWIFYSCLVFHISGHPSCSPCLHLLYSSPEHTIPFLIYHIKGTSTAVTKFVLLVGFCTYIPLTSPKPRLQYLSLEINLRIEYNKYGGPSSGRNLALRCYVYTRFSVVLVRKRTTPTERPLLVGEGLVVRVPGYRSRGPGLIPGATRFS
jgi:hypothetical protein